MAGLTRGWACCRRVRDVLPQLLIRSPRGSPPLPSPRDGDRCCRATATATATAAAAPPQPTGVHSFKITVNSVDEEEDVFVGFTTDPYIRDRTEESPTSDQVGPRLRRVLRGDARSLQGHGT